MKKRIFSILLCLAMLLPCIAVFPVSATGEETATPATASDETVNADGSITIKEGFTIPNDDNATKYGDAEEYPWALFKKTGETYNFIGAYKLFFGDSASATRTDTTLKTTYFTGAFHKLGNVSGEYTLVLRSDYTIKTKDTAVMLDEFYIDKTKAANTVRYCENGVIAEEAPLKEGTSARIYNCAWDNSDSNTIMKTGQKATIDLNGYTFNMNSEGKTLSLRNKLSSGTGTRDLVFTNGVISNIKSMFTAVGNNKTANDKNATATIGIAFENIKLTFAEGADRLISHTVESGETAENSGNFYPAINVNVRFINSILDISACAETYKAFNVTTTTGSVAVNFDKDSKIVSSNVVNESNIMTVGEDAKGTCTFNEGKVALEKYSTTLGETLGINFKAKLPANVAKVAITLEGEEPVITNVENIKLGNLDVFSSSVSSINVRKEIKIEFLDADGVAIDITSTKETANSYTTSVFEYASALKNSTDPAISEEHKAAAEALLTYAAYAEIYFADKSASAAGTVDEQYTDNIIDIAGAGLADITAASAGEGIKSKLGLVYLNLDNATEIRIKIKEALGGDVVSENANIKLEGDYIVISDIDAKNLATGYSFSVSGVENSEVTISAVSVAKVVMESDAYNVNFQNLMKALCIYAEASAKLSM